MFLYIFSSFPSFHILSGFPYLFFILLLYDISLFFIYLLPVLHALRVKNRKMRKGSIKLLLFRLLLTEGSSKKFK